MGLDHARASQRLPDYVAGMLQAEEAAGVEAHVASCAECREVEATIRLVRSEVSETGGDLFEDHPPSDHLVAFAAAEPNMLTADLARIGNHIRVCPTCRLEAQMSRKALSEFKPGLMSTLRELLDPRMMGPWRILGPALAFVLLIALYPTYLGVIKYPVSVRNERQARHASSELAKQQVELQSSLQSAETRAKKIAEWSGGFRLLYLPALRRAGAETLPQICILPGQPSQPILAEFERAASLDPSSKIGVLLRRTRDGQQVWGSELRISEIWDAGTRSVGLLIPAAVLVPGEYSLELRTAEAGEPNYSSRFEVSAFPENAN